MGFPFPFAGFFFPSFADFADDGDDTSEDNSPAAMHSAMNLEKNFRASDLTRRSSIGTDEVPVRRALRRAASDEPLETLASDAATISRCGSSNLWWRVSDVPVARRHAREPGPLQRERPARAALPEWPAVDNARSLLEDGKLHLLSFDLDPTTLPTDVLCHLALEMFVSAGLPSGLVEDRVRRFILAVRASMLDNPYHNFYHVFDVMQTTNALAVATGTMARLDSWERFALLSAALCHDLVNPQPPTLNP